MQNVRKPTEPQNNVSSCCGDSEGSKLVGIKIGLLRAREYRCTLMKEMTSAEAWQQGNGRQSRQPLQIG